MHLSFVHCHHYYHHLIVIIILLYRLRKDPLVAGARPLWRPTLPQKLKLTREREILAREMRDGGDRGSQWDR
jgi:hypothetical protein